MSAECVSQTILDSARPSLMLLCGYYYKEESGSEVLASDQRGWQCITNGCSVRIKTETTKYDLVDVINEWNDMHNHPTIGVSYCTPHRDEICDYDEARVAWIYESNGIVKRTALKFMGNTKINQNTSPEEGEQSTDDECATQTWPFLHLSMHETFKNYPGLRLPTKLYNETVKSACKSMIKNGTTILESADEDKIEDLFGKQSPARHCSGFEPRKRRPGKEAVHSNDEAARSSLGLSVIGEGMKVNTTLSMEVDRGTAMTTNSQAKTSVIQEKEQQTCPSTISAATISNVQPSSSRLEGLPFPNFARTAESPSLEDLLYNGEDIDLKIRRIVSRMFQSQTKETSSDINISDPNKDDN